MAIHPSSLKKILGVCLLGGGALTVTVALFTSLVSHKQSETVHTRELPALHGDYTVHMRPHPRDTRLTDVVLYDADSRREIPFITLPSIYRDHYHAAEFVDGMLYIIKRVGEGGEYVPGRAWTDELWKYPPSGKGINLYATPGLDFRVSGDMRQIAIRQRDDQDPNGWMNMITITDLAGKRLQKISWRDLPGMTNHDKTIDLIGWYKNILWLQTRRGAQLTDLYSIDVMRPSGTIAYHLPDSVMTTDFALEPASKVLAHSTYAEPEYADGKIPRQTATLQAYDLATHKNISLFTASIIRPFEPTWITSTTIEFNDPGGMGRITTSTQL